MRSFILRLVLAADVSITVRFSVRLEGHAILSAVVMDKSRQDLVDSHSIMKLQWSISNNSTFVSPLKLTTEHLRHHQFGV
jgi:hypothetical protein